MGILPENFEIQEKCRDNEKQIEGEEENPYELKRTQPFDCNVVIDFFIIYHDGLPYYWWSTLITLLCTITTFYYAYLAAYRDLFE